MQKFTLNMNYDSDATFDRNQSIVGVKINPNGIFFQIENLNPKSGSFYYTIANQNICMKYTSQSQ